MRRVVSVSLGSSKRDHKVEAEILGEKFLIERIGTDGDMNQAIKTIRELDGKVDAFGLGGADLYLHAGSRRYLIRDAARIVAAAKKTPIVDGSGLKNTLERKVIEYLHKNTGIEFTQKRILLVCAVDRFGMAEALALTGGKVTFGDLIFALGLPVPLRSLKTVDRLARVVAPIICKLPFKYLYPTGQKQEEVKPRFSKYYKEADIIAGDFHFIRRYMPEDMTGKVIITNTVTKEDVELLKQRGVKTLVTTTPELEGRSFGTNVMEGVLLVLSGKPLSEIQPADYEELLNKINFTPRIVNFDR
ncbi:quinate 5-dehydrogenase [Calderihabitans maritimus]|uniref:Quinate 5-dehydrogenase n=1 Tax=Calderihabitans maritimus TaxID=1246530 RepID=A0A1Z5HUB8_9FIRM|nr:quinate 5-dehydrogenase [Calderihabitans maritimus]GAW92880.1 hypothetical protein Toce_2080 [Calderihabitans maritimus]